MTRPAIIREPGRLPWIVDEAEKVILANYEHWGLYQRGGLLVRVVIAAADDNKIVRRPPGAVILGAADSTMLEDIFGRAIAFRNLKGQRYRLPRQDRGYLPESRRDVEAADARRNRRGARDARRRERAAQTWL